MLVTACLTWLLMAPLSRTPFLAHQLSKCAIKKYGGLSKVGKFSASSHSRGLSASGESHDPITVVFFTNVPVSPHASAAGVRTKLLLELFLEEKNALFPKISIDSVHLVSPELKESSGTEIVLAQSTRNGLEEDGVVFHSVRPNRSEDMTLFLSKITDRNNPRLLCVFDRFFTEEMFSHSVRKFGLERGDLWEKNTVFVLDMQDMHSLRRGREEVLRCSADFRSNDGLEALDDILKHRPSADDRLLQRELASIGRCDLTFVCSPFEQHLLQQLYNLPSDKLVLAPLRISPAGDETPTSNSLVPLIDRQDACFVGGFKHAPNIDAVHQLARLWPRLRRNLQCPSTSRPTRLFIYGAYASPHLRQMWRSTMKSQPGVTKEDMETFVLHGFVPGPISDVLSKHKAFLAPLRFGAGLKGKLVEAWQSGTPVVSTSIGAEGFTSFPGRVADTDDAFVQDAAALLSLSESAWNDLSEKSVLEMKKHNHLGPGVWPFLIHKMKETFDNLSLLRKTDYMQGMLWHESNRSTEMFSKNLECKERQSTR